MKGEVMARRAKKQATSGALAGAAGEPTPEERVMRMKAAQTAFLEAQKAQDWPAALRAVEQLRALAPDSAPLKVVQARLLHDEFSQSEPALALLREALDGFQDQAEIYETMSSIHINRGEFDAAKACAETAIDLNPQQAIAYINLLKLDKSAAKEREPALRAAISAGGFDAQRGAFLLNALGRMREAAGDYDAAWTCFASSKKATRPISFDLEGSEAVVHEARAVFTRKFLEERKKWGVSDDRMVFVVGLPRSGTTLVERILAAHSDVGAAGESLAVQVVNRDLGARAAEYRNDKVGRYAHLLDLTSGAARKAAERYLFLIENEADRPGAARIVDKMPANFAHLGLITLLFPRSRIIHVGRDPLDVFISSFKEMFRNPQPQTHDPMTFAYYAILQEEIMEHWRALFGERILDVQYEQIVRAPEAEARRIIEHVGLEWSDACAAPHEAAGDVMTASAAQVREPVHARSVGAWRRYEKHLAPIKDVFDRYRATKKAEGDDAEAPGAPGVENDAA